MSWPQPNPHGVYLEEQCEVLSLPHVGTSKALRAAPLAKVFLVEIGAGVWMEATSFQFSHGSMRGGGSLPRLRMDPRYQSRDEALKVASDRLIRIARNVLAERHLEMERAQTFSHWEPNISAGQEREAKSLEAWAGQLLTGVEGQMELQLA